MKKKQLKSWRNKSDQEIVALIDSIMSDLMKLKMELKTGKLKNFRAVRAKRRDLAVAKTLLCEKKLGLNKPTEGKE